MSNETKLILNNINDLVEKIMNNYNVIQVVDNYYYDNNIDKNITNFYLNKNESFSKFEDLWLEFYNEHLGEDYYTIIEEFNKIAKEKFDYFESNFIQNVCTDSIYELEI